MALYSYVIARDYGFAPNPFHGVCTLATCKSVIRRVAQVGDWVIGTGAAEHKRTGELICAMRVSATMSFEDYWADPRFFAKRPDLTGSRMQNFGDNIYSRNADGTWAQLDSHHSFPGGKANQLNVDDDTKTNRVLIASEFWYFGEKAIPLPAEFRRVGHGVVCPGRNHRKYTDAELIDSFVAWLRQLPTGCSGRPDRWP